MNDYIGHAGGFIEGIKPGWRAIGKNVHPRHVRVRSIEPEANSKKHYKDIPVLKTNPPWTGLLAQKVVMYGQEFETIKKVDEKEYGRKGAAEERRLIKEKRAKAPQDVRAEK